MWGTTRPGSPRSALLIGLAACLACGDGAGPRPGYDAGGEVAADVGTDGVDGAEALEAVGDATNDAGDDAPGPPGIGEVVTSCPDPDALVSPRVSAPRGDGRLDLHRVTLDDPAALCNDGTPAVLYVRAATDPARASEFLVLLEAGGACTDADSCYDRWCGLDAPYSAAKMSSRWAPEVVEAKGLLREATEVPALPSARLGGRNVIFAYYCSSDIWTGRRDAELTTSDGTTFRVYFRGHDIVAALFDALEAGVSSDDGVETLPAVASGDHLLFAGSSAGCGGLLQHADWASARLAGRGVTVDAMADGCVRVDFDRLGLTATERAAIEDEQRAGYETVFRGLWDAFLDESCLDLAAADGQYLCANLRFVARHHVTTPLFLREDFLDPTDLSEYRGTSVGPLDYAAAMHDTLADLRSAGIDGTEAGAVVRAPAVHGPACGQHIALLNDGFTHTSTVDGATLHDAMGDWLDGRDVEQLYERVDGEPDCATVTDER
jgi:hypothetical protein